MTASPTAIFAARPPAELHRLLTWFSPAFPIGAYTYSHGLEWAVEAGDVVDGASLTAWVADVLRHGAGWSDAVLIACAHRAAAPPDEAALAGLAELAAAMSPTAERHLEAVAQGRAFARAIADTSPCAPVDALLALDADLALPVVIGAASAGHDLALHDTLAAALHAFCANLVSAGVRLVPLGQTDGLRAIQALQPDCAAIAERARTATVDDLAGSAFLADIASCRHETQHTRLFRS